MNQENVVVADDAIARILAPKADAALLDLSIGEPDQPVPDALKELAAKSLLTDQTGYTAKPGILELRELLCLDIKDASGFEPGPDDVTVTVGGSEAVTLAMMVTCGVDRPVVIPDPAWPNYRLFAEAIGAEVIRYEQGNSGDDFFNFPQIEAALERGARLVVVNSPSNPAATVASADALARLVTLVREHDAFILSDEAYESIIFSGGRAPSPMTTGADITLCARTFSKTYSMTGMRLGALVSPKKLSLAVGGLHGVVTGCAPITSQLMGIEALRSHGYRRADLSRDYRERFAVAHEILGDWVAPAPIESLGGFYLWVDGRATGRDSSSLVAELRDRGIVVSSGRVYTDVEGYFRIALTLPMAELRPVLATVREVLAGA